MFSNEEFKKPIIKQKTRILRPREFKRLLSGCPKTDYRTMLQTLLYTGMRYIELKRFQQYPSWFDSDFVHLPQEATRKKARTQKERWVKLNQPGKMIVEYFTNIKTPVPTYVSFNANLKCWAKRANLDPEGLSVKTTRKTYESWLMYYFPERRFEIALSQGHTTLTSLGHYLNMPFTEVDKVEMRNFVEGWC